MSDANPEIAGSDPSATSIANDQAVNKVSDPGQVAEKPGTSVDDAAPEAPKASDPVLADEGSAEVAAVEAEGNKANDAGAADAKAAGSKTQSPPKRQHDDRNDREGRPKRSRKGGNLFDPTIQDETDDPIAIRKQVEFYFSDANLARDKFLYDKIEGTKNTPIELQVIHSFKRMRRFQPYEAVIKALKESEFLEVTEDEKLKRKVPLSTDFENKTLAEITKVHEDESMVRSVYVKGFGWEQPGTQFDIEAWFAKFGPTNQVRLRRADDKTFKGSVFVEFDNEETAKSFLALDPKPKFNERELKILSKKQYCDEKVQQIQEGKIQPNGKSYSKKGNNDRDWRERREEDRKNGFKDKRGRGGHRGRGRGGRGRGNDRRGPRERDAEAPAKANDAAAPEESKKRSRDIADDEGREAKKEKVETES